MERFRQKKSKVPTTNQRNKQTQRQKSVPNLAPESGSYNGDINKEDLTGELGRASSRRVTGTPIKKLLAEEMSKETETRRGPTGVIARLMGLDGLPPQQPLHRQHKGFLETYRQRTTPVVSPRDGKRYENRFHRKNSKEQEEFKDVYEVSETSKVDRSSKPLKGTVNPKLSEMEMVFVRQKFMDAKRLSTDEKFHTSKEFCDTLDMLDTNKDLLMKFLQQPDSLFTKHLHDLQGTSPRSQCSHVEAIKPSNSGKYESNTIVRKSKKETSTSWCDTSSHRKHHGGFPAHSDNHRCAQKPLKPSKIQLGGKHETDIFPARIVVLKPNLDKVQNSTNSVSSPDCRKHTGVGAREATPWVKKNLSSDAGFLRSKSRESREIAKEITSRMRESFGSEQIDMSSMFRGYSGDESSHNVSGIDSSSESEVAMLSSRKSYHWSIRRKPPSSNSIESSISKEAKTRLSQRWKISHKYQDVGVVAKGSTLGEMLAIPDREIRPEILDPMICLDGSSDRFVSSDEIMEWESPLGISSSDGWKDECVRNSSRLRSAPVSSVSCGGPKTTMQRETLDQNNYLISGKTRNRGRTEAINGNLSKKEDSSSRNLRSSCKKSQPPCCSYSDSTYSLEERRFNQAQMEFELGKKDPSEQKNLISEVPANTVNSAGSITYAGEHDDMIMSSESPDELPPNSCPCLLGNDYYSTPGPEDSKAQDSQIGPSRENSFPLQYTVPEPPSPTSSKEDRESPVSVLEDPFTEDVSSGSECFERVSADLHELRMQLKLLKMESGEHADDEVFMASEKDVSQESITVSKEKALFEDDSWESTYLVDVLNESGFDDVDPDTILATWHDSECPVGSWVFDNLEKKYSDETTWLRSERRLLFDRLNLSLVEMSQSFSDPWAKLLTRKLRPRWSKHGIKYELCKLLASEEKKVNEDVTEKVLDSEMQWVEFGNDLDMIGRELEKLLIDDLIAEVANL